MGTEVYANGREISCKASSGKTIADFPDTCLSPPSPPAGPIPIPYPNTAYASDTTNGSTTVMICGQEVMLKDQSTFKKSTGNEAATKSLGMGVVTHTIQGEASFIIWSMDVKFEGQNVDRHLDMTVPNEQSMGPDGPPANHTSAQADGKDPDECHNGTADNTKPCFNGKADHDIVCNQRYCEACIDRRQPHCAEEAAADEQAYAKTQEGPPSSRAQKGLFRRLDETFDETRDGKGPMFELRCLQAFQERDDFITTEYLAHCKVCHMKLELDIVTKDYVLECKSNVSNIDRLQFEQRIVPTAKKCFPGKKVALLTDSEPAKNLKDAKSIVANWLKDKGLNIGLFVLDTAKNVITQIV